ncbi:MAG: hypothetical protein EOM12_07550 [Verrucomicrobiae bacterium]|nr:hypothetical protein [Verrucomicrobiae bacterium]
MMKKISFKFWVPFIGACLLILGIFCVIPTLPPLGPTDLSVKTQGTLHMLIITFNTITIESENFSKKNIFTDGTKNMPLKENFLLIMKKYLEYDGYKFAKDSTFDGWGNTFNVDYTTNIIKINYRLSESDSILKNRFLNKEHVEEIKHHPIIVWSSGPNGIDERCLGDDIVW